jgi:hypothetical protein
VTSHLLYVHSFSLDLSTAEAGRTEVNSSNASPDDTTQDENQPSLITRCPPPVFRGIDFGVNRRDGGTRPIGGVWAPLPNRLRFTEIEVLPLTMRPLLVLWVLVARNPAGPGSP